MAQHTIGIDIQADRLAIACLKKSFRKIRLASHARYSLEREMPLRKKLDTARELLRDFMKENRISAADIFVGIPGELAIFKELEFPSAVKENLRSTLRYEMEKHVPLPADDVHFDYQILSEGKNRVSLLLAVTKKSALTPYLDFSGTLAGGVSGMAPCSVATANFLAHASGKSASLLKKDTLGLLKAKPSAEELSANGIPSPELAPGFGLGLGGLWDTPLKINLLPPDLRKRPGRAGYHAMIVLAAAALLSGAAWGGSHILQHKMVLEHLDAEMIRLKTELANIDRIRQDVESLKERVDYLNTLRGAQLPGSEILKELSHIVPETAWVRELTFYKNEVQLDGYADSASELLPILENSPLFRDAVFLSTITKNKEGKERFRIGMKIN